MTIIKQLIAKQRFTEIFEILFRTFPQENEIYLLKGSFTQVETEYKARRITYDAYELRIARIGDSILYFAEKLSADYQFNLESALKKIEQKIDAIKADTSELLAQNRQIYEKMAAILPAQKALLENAFGRMSHEEAQVVEVMYEEIDENYNKKQQKELVELVKSVLAAHKAELVKVLPQSESLFSELAVKVEWQLIPSIIPFLPNLKMEGTIGLDALNPLADLWKKAKKAIFSGKNERKL